MTGVSRYPAVSDATVAAHTGRDTVNGTDGSYRAGTTLSVSRDGDG
jgi:hypothetical protein